MEKRIVKFATVLVLLGILNFSCSPNNEEKRSEANGVFYENKLFDKFFYQVLDSVTANCKLDGKILVHHDIYPDNVKHITINGVIKANEDGGEKIELLRKLTKILDDSVRLNIDELKSERYSFYHLEQSIEQYVDFNSSDFFGSVNLSQIVYSEGSAAFYIAIQGGNNCGSGHIALFSKKADDWILSQIIKIWDAKNMNPNFSSDS